MIEAYFNRIETLLHNFPDIRSSDLVTLSAYNTGRGDFRSEDVATGHFRDPPRTAILGSCLDVYGAQSPFGEETEAPGNSEGKDR